jgi:hypothetical protein
MNPEQQLPPPPGGGNYDFIMNPGKPPKGGKGLGAVANNRFIMILVAIVGSAVVLMIAIALILNVFVGSKTNLADLVTITQTEQELIRVSKQSKYASDQAIRNAAMSTELTLETQKQEWLTFLAKYGQKVDDKRLALKKDTATDKRLTNAKQTSTYDSTYTLIMRSQLEAYGASLQDAYNNATNKQERTLLRRHYQQVQLLLKQWPS